MEKQNSSVAQRIKGLRIMMNIPLEEMALATSVSVNDYIDCEEGKTDPSFTFLYKCANRFGIDISELVTGDDPKLSFYTLSRKDEGMPIKRRKGFNYQHMASMFKKRLSDPFVVEAKYSKEEENAPIKLSSHNGQEYDYILSGQLKVQLDDKIEILGEGDSIYYDSTHKHGMVAIGGKDCKFLAIVIKGEENVKTEPLFEGGHEVSKKTDTELFYKKYVKETINENGSLTDIEFNIPDNFNFGFDVVDEIAKKNANKPAMVWVSDKHEKKVFSFSDMSKYSSMAANYFRSLGIKKGDKVMLVLRRNYQFWFAIVALHKLGAIAVPATDLLTKKDFEYRFNTAGVKAIVCTGFGKVSEYVEEALPASPTVKIKIIADGKRDGWYSFDDGMKEQSDVFERPSGDQSVCSTDPMLMYFTSGTVGYPKIVTHDFRYPFGHVVTARWWHNVDPQGLHLTVADTGWAKSVWGKLYGQWLCEATVFTYDYDKFDADDLLSMFAKYRITTFCAPPTIYRMFIKEDLSKYDMSSLKHATIAGEALNPEVFQQFYNATGIKLMEGFGQTETTLTIANLIGTEPKPGSMGKPNPQYNVDLLGPDGNSAKVGEVGEIVLRTDGKRPCGMFMGYYQDEDKTKAVWDGKIYHTGDMAWRDEDGYFWYVARTDDLIKSSGYRIGPFEIESVLMEIPYVLECAVTGVPDEVRGQLVKATIILTKGTQGSDKLKKEIQDYVKAHTAPYKYPRVIEFVEELPKTISGKIRRVEIREEDKGASKK